MNQPIMKCIYSSEQIKEQMELMEYIYKLQRQISFLKSCIKSGEQYDEKTLENV